MHRLLKRQLKKSGLTQSALLENPLCERFVTLVDQSYQEGDDDRNFLEHSLEISSKEMQELYKELEARSRRKVEESEAKYSRLIANLKHHYFFYTHNREGIFIYLSDSITDMLGYSKEEFSKHYATYLSDDPMNVDVKEKTQKVLTGEVQEPYTVSIYHKDGSIRVLEVMEQPIFNDEGVVTEVDGIARDITEVVQTQEELNNLAKYDALTGISNRSNLYTNMEFLIASSQREGKRFAVLFLDLDHFKDINDTLGHDIGDKLLQEVVKRISPNIRAEDLFARIGGDEFVIVLNNVRDGYLGGLLNKLLTLLREEFLLDNFEVKVSSSIGVALYPDDGKDITTLMKNADIAMYKAKESGRDDFSFYTERLNEEVQQKVHLERAMSHALEAGAFELFFQPKVLMKNDHIIGAEALIRWREKDGKILLPELFIPLAESTGFIIKLGRWVIEEGCKTIAELNAMGYDALNLSINLSTRQIQNDDIYEVISTAISTHNIHPSQLALEITESVMITQVESTLHVLEKLKTLGVKICLDDFGTGYSALSYLHRFPIDAVKIDKSFIDLIPKDGTKTVLLDTIIAMGETLNIKLIAEGIEEPYQLKYLQEKPCDYYQGYLFSKAVEKVHYIEMLKGQS